MDDGYVSVEGAARTLRVSKRAVRNMVAGGRLEAGWEGEGATARLMVSAASVERLLGERRMVRAPGAGSYPVLP